MENEKYCSELENNNLQISEIVHLTLTTLFSKQLLEEMQKILKDFIWNN